MNKRKVKRALRKILTAVLCVVMFLSLVTGIVAAMMNSTLKDSSSLVIDVVNAEYNDILYRSLTEELEKKMALVVIKPEDISDIITEELVQDVAPVSTGSLINRLFGGDDDIWEYKSDELRARIDELLVNYAAQMGIEYEEGSGDQVYEMICDVVSSEMNVIPQAYISKVAPFVVKLGKLCSYWYVPVIVYAVCVIAVLLIGRKRIKNAIYNAVLPSYFATFTVFAVSAVLYSKDYLAKTIIKNEAFQHLLRQIYNSVLLNIRNTATTLSVVFVLMAVVVILAMVIEKIKHRRQSSPG